jgi:hypothetical protein
MKRTSAVGIPLIMLLALSAPAQMMEGGGYMGGGRRTMVNLVSPTDSAIQIKRGVLMIGQHTSMMQTLAPESQTAPSRVWLLLRVYGVSDGAGLVTNAGNRLLFEGRLSTTSGESPIAIDQTFGLRDGAAFVRVPVDLPPLMNSPRILIDQIAVLDAAGATFALPGVSIGSPIVAETPAPTPETRCTRNTDCDDQNPDTRDLCMPVGCVHMPDHMGGGPMM